MSVKGYQDYLPSDYMLVPSYGNDFALLSTGRERKRQQQQGRQQKSQPSAAAAEGDSSSTAAAEGEGAAGIAAADGSSDPQAAAAGSSGVVVEDFGEFMYFIVSPKVRSKQHDDHILTPHA